jgi:6-phosphogluconolactonase
MTAPVATTLCAGAAEAATAAAREAARLLSAAIEDRGRALLAVSGGSSPVPMFEALRQQPIAWYRITVLTVDERCVPIDHPDSNAALVERHLRRDAAALVDLRPFFDHLPDTALDAPTLAALARDANARLAGLIWPIDVCVLGMGEDGHTASLFAGAPGLDEALSGTGPVAWTRPPTARHARLTLTLPTMLAARHLLLPLVGPAKRRVFEQACAAPSRELPVSLVLHGARQPVQVWLAD